MVVLLVFLVVVIMVGFCAIISFNDKEDKMAIEVAYSETFDRLLKNVTTEEQKLYRKIINQISYHRAENYKVEYDTIDCSYKSITIGNISLKMRKTLKKHIYSYYECTGIHIKNGRDTIMLTPPKQLFEIYDLFVDYAVWKLYLLAEETRKDEEKQFSKTYQEELQKALKAIK